MVRLTREIGRKKSIFFELPYWEHHLIHHNLDVMHIEKNVCDNILWTVVGVPGKCKDNLKAQRFTRIRHKDNPTSSTTKRF